MLATKLIALGDEDDLFALFSENGFPLHLLIPDDELSYSRHGGYKANVTIINLAQNLTTWIMRAGDYHGEEGCLMPGHCESLLDGSRDDDKYYHELMLYEDVEDEEERGEEEQEEEDVIGLTARIEVCYSDTYNGGFPRRTEFEDIKAVWQHLDEMMGDSWSSKSIMVRW